MDVEDNVAGHPAPPAAHPVRRAGGHLLPYVAIAAGGIIGANARYLVGVWLTDALGVQFPWGTLFVNVTGSFGLGLLLTLMISRFTVHAAVRLAIATGFFGAYTTFSTFTVDGVKLLEAGAVAEGLAYIVGSTVFSLVGAIAGVLLAEAIASSMPARTIPGESDPAR